jgi:toxin ParE1/3/4
VAREGRRGRHFVLFRAGPEQTIEVLRILHDAMDLSRHLSKD